MTTKFSHWFSVFFLLLGFFLNKRLTNLGRDIVLESLCVLSIIGLVHGFPLIVRFFRSQVYASKKRMWLAFFLSLSILMYGSNGLVPKTIDPEMIVVMAYIPFVVLARISARITLFFALLCVLAVPLFWYGVSIDISTRVMTLCFLLLLIAAIQGMILPDSRYQAIHI